MRKHIEVITPSTPKKVAVSIKKIVLLLLILAIILGTAGVMANNESIKDVTIILSSGYEMNVKTSFSKVSDILNENKIILLDSEKVEPGLDEEVPDNHTIKITKESGEEQLNKAIASNFSAEDIINSYSVIVEKLITIQEEIPYETVTKDVSNGGTTQNKVVQAGQNGIKEITYRVKYQNDQEIERTQISENIVKEPVNKIVEVRTSVTNRSNYARSTSLGSESEESARAWIINKESGGNYYASNKGRYLGAYQLSASKLKVNGKINWDPAYQDAVANNYVRSRYGSWVNAKAFWVSHGWY